MTVSQCTLSAIMTSQQQMVKKYREAPDIGYLAKVVKFTPQFGRDVIVHFFHHVHFFIMPLSLLTKGLEYEQTPL